MNTIKTLVIFELRPLSTTKAVVDLTQEEYSYFSKCHGHTVNVDGFDEEKSNIIELLQHALCSDEELLGYAETEEQKEYFGKWADFILDEDCSDLEGVQKLISAVYYC